MGLVVLGEDLHAHNIDWGEEGIGMGSEEREGRTVGSEGGRKEWWRGGVKGEISKEATHQACQS